MIYILNRGSSWWVAALSVGVFASIAAAHETVTVSGKVSQRTDGHVVYYFDQNGKALFAERMKSASDRAVKPLHTGVQPPPIPQTPDDVETKKFVTGACPASDRTRVLSKWESHFGKKAKFTAYYSVDYTEPKNPLLLLVVEDLDALSSADRDTRNIRLLCSQEEGSHAHCGGGHRCTIP